MAKNSGKTSRNQLIKKIMAWVLSILMMGSVATLAITMLLNH